LPQARIASAVGAFQAKTKIPAFDFAQSKMTGKRYKLISRGDDKPETTDQYGDSNQARMKISRASPE
jgi:hypothetical protein